jgi:hypothetical protein
MTALSGRRSARRRRFRFCRSAALPHAEVLVRELQAFKVEITEAGTETYGGKGQHDDLVLAVALAVWRAGR